MSWFNNALVYFAVSQLLTVGIYFFLHHRNQLGQLISLLSVCLIASLLSALPVLLDNQASAYILRRITSPASLLLYVIAFQLFVDGGKIRVENWMLGGYYLVARIFSSPFYDPVSTYSTISFILIYVIPQVIIFYFSISAIVIAALGRQSDLIEERRRFRLFFIIGIGIHVALRAVNGFFSFSDPFLDYFPLFSLSSIPEYYFTIYLFIISLALNVSLSRYNKNALNLLSSTANVEVDATPGMARLLSDNPNLSLIKRITDKMENDKAFAIPGFTIAMLAKSISIQEYRLRKIINKELKYRNFNQFLNYYRINNASVLLLESSAPISVIAMDTGYISLSSFNTAFKSRYGVTPKEYRKKSGVL